MREKPNKAPEPTTFAVTSRATIRFAEMKPRNDRPIAARAAPAKVVAHLERSAKVERASSRALSIQIRASVSKSPQS
jgi:hypothetical protein